MYKLSVVFIPKYEVIGEMSHESTTRCYIKFSNIPQYIYMGVNLVCLLEPIQIDSLDLDKINGDVYSYLTKTNELTLYKYKNHHNSDIKQNGVISVDSHGNVVIIYDY